MSYQVITDFRNGLDARKFKLALPPGTLLACDNAHITPGGEIEKRKSFVPVTIPAVYAGIHFGLQPADDGIFIFGSTIVAPATSTRDRTTNVARLKLPNASGFFIVGDIVNISGLADASFNGINKTITAVTNSAGDQYISYASVGANVALNTVDTGGTAIKVSSVLPAPLVYDLVVYPGAVGGVGWQNYENLQAIVSSTVFGGAPFVLAKFADGVFPFYGAGETYVWNGSGLTTSTVGNAARLVEDSVAGLQLNSTAYDTGGTNLLETLDALINASGSYTGTFTFPSIEDIFSIPTTLNGTPYSVDVTLESAAGTLTVAQQTTGQASTAAAQAVAVFQIISAGSGTQATGTVTDSAGTNFNDGDTVTIGATVYRFKNAPAQAYDVKIQADRYKTYASFAAAINGFGTAGTDYFAGTAKHTTVIATALQASGGGNAVLYLAAITGGTAGNAIALASTAGTRATVSGATLSGAVDSKINQIVVNGATNLLNAAVSFATSESVTAAAVAAGINAFPASGYQATSQGATVTILKQVAGAGANGFSVQVQAQGTIVCGTGAFTLTGSGFTVDYCKANGVDLMNDTILPSSESVMTFPQAPSLEAGATAFAQVLSDFCRAVANNINTGTATHGYLAHCAQGSVSIYVSKATTTSTDAQAVLDVSVTASVGQSGSAIPVTVTPLSVALDLTAIAVGEVTSAAVTATALGGVGPFTYQWVQQGSNAIGIKANQPKAAQTTFSAVALNGSLRVQLRTYNNLATSALKATYLQKHPALQQYLSALSTNQVTFVCTVTDVLGEQATSDPLYITILALST
jgi:hypothetical protein